MEKYCEDAWANTPALLIRPDAKVAELLRATGTSTAELHRGEMRCDVNISLGLNSSRVEIKNLNSVSAIRDACFYEIGQQIEQSVNNKVPITPATKRWTGEVTEIIRKKEGEQDYRYLPDADIPPLILSEEFIQKARDDIPPLPEYLISILLNPPHNLPALIAKRLSLFPDALTYYNAVLEVVPFMEGSVIARW